MSQVQASTLLIYSSIKVDFHLLHISLYFKPTSVRDIIHIQLLQHAPNSYISTTYHACIFQRLTICLQHLRFLWNQGHDCNAIYEEQKLSLHIKIVYLLHESPFFYFVLTNTQKFHLSFYIVSFNYIENKYLKIL